MSTGFTAVSWLISEIEDQLRTLPNADALNNLPPRALPLTGGAKGLQMVGAFDTQPNLLRKSL